MQNDILPKTYTVLSYTDLQLDETKIFGFSLKTLNRCGFLMV